MPHSDITITVDHPISMQSNRSVEYGMLLAIYLNASVHLLHVIDLEALTGLSVPESLKKDDCRPSSVSDMRRRVRTRMEALQQRIEHMSKAQIPVTIHIEAGYPDQQIAKCLNTLHHPLTVVGKDSDYGVMDYIWGNTTTDLLNQQLTNLLIVPDKRPFRPLRDLLFVFQGEANEVDDLREFIQLAKPFNGNIRLLGLAQDVDKQEELAAKAKQLEALLPNTTPSSPIFVGSDHLARLRRYMDQHTVDLLALRYHPHTWLHRLTGQDPVWELLMKTGMPLLIFNQDDISQ